ncbi:MAG TPA: fructosamine kinase family protein [Mucilaginibacter sp.]|nr:fructosamine kinase family protein [Mucilaginibacter sp.]
MLSSALKIHLEEHLGVELVRIQPVSGGSINRTYRVSSDTTDYFLKLNDELYYPGLFEAEAKGLNIIAGTHTVSVPGVLLQGSVQNEAFLLLEWIEARRAAGMGAARLGEQLASMHRVSANHFGLKDDNYMGSLRQSNRKHSKWSDFFIAERIQPMVSLAFDRGLLTTNDAKGFDLLFQRLPDLFNEEQPSLIHGDLWGGNYLIDVYEKPYLIDPAVCYANREADIAMTTLFGGFERNFYQAYQQAFPLSEGWQRRIDLWNLYPLLVHLNLFGPGYLGQVKDCLKQYL